MFQEVESRAELITKLANLDIDEDVELDSLVESLTVSSLRLQFYLLFLNLSLKVHTFIMHIWVVFAIETQTQCTKSKTDTS